MPFLNWILIACCLGLAAWAGLRAARDQPVILKQLIAAGGVLALMFVTMIVAGVQLSQGHHIDDGVTFWGYYIAAVFVFLGAGVWAFADRTRWSSVVLIVAAVAFAVVQLRLLQFWGTLGSIGQVGAP